MLDTEFSSYRNSSFARIECVSKVAFFVIDNHHGVMHMPSRRSIKRIRFRTRLIMDSQYLYNAYNKTRCLAMILCEF
jgi:hypothetical protein